MPAAFPSPGQTVGRPRAGRAGRLAGAVALSAVLLGLPAVALAKDKPTIAIVGVHDEALDPARQREAVATLTDVISSERRFEIRTPDDVSRMIAGREGVVLAEAYLTGGRRLLEDGRTLHDQAQPEEAIPVLEQAIQSLVDAMPASDATRELWEAHLYLGACHQELGRDADATAAWRTAVALNPDRQPDAARIAPPIVQGYEDTKLDALKTTGALSVKASGAASVVVNGVDRGTSPVKLDDLPVGPVHIRAKANNGAVAYKAAEVFKDTTASVELELGEPRLPPAGTTRFSRIRAATDLYKTLGKQAPVDLILLVGGREGQATVQLYAPPADAFSNPLEVSYEGDVIDEVAEALPGLLDVVTDEGRLPSIATTPTAAPLDPADNRMLAGMLLDPQPLAPPAPSGRRTGAFVAGGVGALLVGGAVTGVLLATGGDGNRGTIIVGPVP